MKSVEERKVFSELSKLLHFILKYYCTPGRKLGRIKPGELKFSTSCGAFYLLWLIQKELNDVVPALGVVEEDKQGPMNEPCPLLEGLKRGGDRLDGTTFGRRTREKNGGEGEKEPQRGKTK